MTTSTARRLLQVAAIIVTVPALAGASPLLDFSTLSVGGKVTNLGTGGITVGAVTAKAYKKSNYNGVWSASNLIARNEPNDQGLGVCSEGLSDCNIGGTGDGDDNELSQLEKTEGILLSLAPDWKWSELWVSSLDSGGTGGKERGKLYWGNTSSVASLISGGKYFDFNFGDFGGAVDGDVLSLAKAAIFDRTAKYALFIPGGTKGENNDYLVYGAGVKSTIPPTSIPEPATVLMFIAAVGVGGARLRYRRYGSNAKAA